MKKSIVQRNLSLKVTYTLVDKKYIPLEESFGICCDNCGKLIANIATVRSAEDKVYDIGFDCLETILINNSLLTTGDIAQYERAKKMIPKIIRFSKVIKERIEANRHINITGLLFEKQSYLSDSYPFYWLRDNQPKSRDNDYVKLKDGDIEFVISTLKNIFPKMTFVYE